MRRGDKLTMGFLNFLNKGKKEEKKDFSIDIPPPPSKDFSDFSQLPSFSDEKEAEIPLPPLEQMEPIDKKIMAELQLPEEKLRFARELKEPRAPFDFQQPQIRQSPPQLGIPEVKVQAQRSEQKPEIFNPFKEEIRKPFTVPEPRSIFERQRPDELKAPIAQMAQPRLFSPLRKQKFIRAENFSVMLEHIEHIKTSSELNRSLGNFKKIKVGSDKEFERFHRSLEDIQRSLFIVDQTMFEEG